MPVRTMRSKPEKNLDTESSYKRFLDLALQDICKRGGASKYVGLQPTFRNEPPLVLFNTPQRSTLALPLCGISAVAAKIAQSVRSFSDAEPAQTVVA